MTAEAKKYYTEEVGTKLKNFYTAKEIFLADANSELCDILADAKGLDQASNGYTSAENYIKPKGEHFLLDYICINPSAHGLPLAITSSTNVDAAITAKTDAIQEQYDTLLKNYNQYKDELKYSLARYTALQTDYELAWDSCADMLEKMENIADSGFPDYVYTHEMGTPMFLNTDNIEIGASSSQIKNKIQSAASSSGGVQHFLDAESEKIEKKYTEFNDLNTKFEGYYTYVRAYLKEMQKLEDFFVSGEYLFERGINTGSYRPVLELMAESTIIHDEDKEYSGGIFEYKDADYYEYMSHTNSHFNTYPLATEKMAKIAAAKAIMMDFRGSGASHAACLERLGAVKENFGSIMRDAKINGGYTQMYYDYIAPLQSAYSDVINGTYSGIYAEIGKSGKTFYDEIYGVLTMYDRVVQDKWFDRNSYTPVTGITDNTGTTTLALGSGKTAQLSASVLPTDATYQGIIWKSTSPDVASVDANGLVTANASGTAEILAIAEDSEADAVTETVADIEVTNYIYKDKYIVKYTVNVSGADYKDITYLPAGVYSSDEIETSKYLWLNFGTDAEPEYFAVSAGERIVTAKYMPAVGSIDTVLLELYDENGGLLASSKCSNIGNDGSPCVLSAVSPKSADRAVVKLYYDEDCTEFFTEIMDEKLHDNTEHTIGDINFDDVVDSRDAKLLLAFISDIAQPSEMQAAVSDVNGDKTTDMLDVIKIFDIIN